MTAITVQNLSKTYRIYGSPYGRLLERLPWNKKVRHTPIHALQDIDFTVEPGSCVGLIGGNGAGKSTLLKILTGTTFPSTGSYEVRGRVASLLELGAGFHQDFTGRENVYMNAAMMGLSRKETRRKYEEILDFSELRHFIDAPIRTYSSGMICRLGFSVAVAIDPDVLIIDEILAVGDMHFQRKCVDRIWEYRNSGKTLFFCSHSLYDVRQICDVAIWMRHGKVAMMDSADAVTNDYATWENQRLEQHDMLLPGSEEAGKAAAGGDDPYAPTSDHPHIVRGVCVDPDTGEEKFIFQPGERAAIRVHVRNAKDPVKLSVATGLTRGDGTLMFAYTTQLDGIELAFEEAYVTLILPDLKLLAGEFVVPIWLMDGNGVHRFHERPAETNLVVQARTKHVGIVLHDHEWRIEPVQPAAAARGRMPQPEGEGAR